MSFSQEKSINEVVEHRDYILGDNIRYRKAIPVLFDGKQYIINPNTILSLNCTSECNANCKFCYNKLTFMPNNKYISADAHSLQRIITLAREAGINSVALTGGEPTLNPQELLRLTHMCCEAGFTTIRLHTNGIRLVDNINWNGRHQELWRHLKDEGLQDISISLASNFQQANQKIMCIDSVSKVQPHLREMANAFRCLRLSCYICQEGINTPAQVCEYLHWGQKHDVKYYIFRFTPDSPEKDSTKMLGYLAKLLKQGYHILYSHCKEDSYIYNCSDGTRHVSFSCVQEYPDKDKKIRRLIYMPDEIVYTSWIQPSSYLFDDDCKRLSERGYSVACKYLQTNTKGITNLEKQFFPDTKYTTDMHVHSMVSDGLLTPQEVILSASKSGIRRIVFAEHNCLHDSPFLLQRYAAENGVEIPFFAVECSSVYCLEGKPQLKFHILLYAKNPSCFDFLKELYNPNIAVNKNLIEHFRDAYDRGWVTKTLEELYHIPDEQAPTAKKLLTRTILAKALSENLLISSEEAKKQYIPQISEETKYARYINAKELIYLAQKNGCVSVIAHPGWIRSYRVGESIDEKDMLEALASLARSGLDGIEVVHRLHDMRMRIILQTTAQQLDLLMIGGSDFHGKPKCKWLVNGCPEEEYEKLYCLVNERWKQLNVK